MNNKEFTNDDDFLDVLHSPNDFYEKCASEDESEGSHNSNT